MTIWLCLPGSRRGWWPGARLTPTGRASARSGCGGTGISAPPFWDPPSTAPVCTRLWATRATSGTCRPATVGPLERMPRCTRTLTCWGVAGCGMKGQCASVSGALPSLVVRWLAVWLGMIRELWLRAALELQVARGRVSLGRHVFLRRAGLPTSLLAALEAGGTCWRQCICVARDAGRVGRSCEWLSSWL